MLKRWICNASVLYSKSCDEKRSVDSINDSANDQWFSINAFIQWHLLFNCSVFGIYSLQNDMIKSKNVDSMLSLFVHLNFYPFTICEHKKKETRWHKKRNGLIKEIQWMLCKNEHKIDYKKDCRKLTLISWINVGIYLDSINSIVSFRLSSVSFSIRFSWCLNAFQLNFASYFSCHFLFRLTKEPHINVQAFMVTTKWKLWINYV